MKNLISLFPLLILFTSCKHSEPKHKWLSGNEYERLDTVAKHLRGNDLVMWEVDVRHQKLYEALKAGNKDYALYQLKKIKLTMKNGAERRPKRAKSYQWFFDHALPPMKEAIIQNNQPIQEFKNLSNSCITCHSMEKVPYMPVNRPWLNKR